MIVYRVKRNSSNQSYCVTLDELKRVFPSELEEIEQSEVGESISITIDEMGEAVFGSVEEFAGW